MILQFPDWDTFTLAVTSGEIPDDIALAPVAASLTDDGPVVDPQPSVPESVTARLRTLGVKTRRDVEFDIHADTWLELLPLRSDPSGFSLGDDQPASRSGSGRLPILFELPDPERLGEIAGEMLRLGNDRQSFRHVELDGEPRTLLRVIGPPYYTLLRAIERHADRSAPVAYREQADGVWVQLGYRHPLGEKITPPSGEQLLISSPRMWRSVAEGRYRDLYEVLDFQLPHASRTLSATELESRLPVSLKLTRSGGETAAELWVVRERALKQLDELVAGASDRLLERIAFAVIPAGAPINSETDPAEPTVVLRVRPGRDAPPVLVLDAEEFVPYLKLPNLFLPIGQRLHPPLRRDAVKGLLASEGSNLTWLMPTEGDGFAPQSVSESAFRPLTDWVEYVLDREQAELTVWERSFEFQFDDFICPEEEAEHERRRAEREKRKDQSGTKTPNARDKPTEPAPKKSPSTRKKSSRSKPKTDGAAAVPTEPIGISVPEARERLTELEREFLDSELPADDPARLPLWREMAELNGRLDQTLDGTLCWANLIWEAETPDRETLWKWYLADAKPSRERGPTARELDSLLNKSNPIANELSGLVAYLAYATADGDPPQTLTDRLEPLQRFLETHEASLPNRVAWIGWRAIYELANRDELTLARARDRLLERLYRLGMTPDRELPSFLRSFGSGGSGGERFRLARDRIVHLHETVEQWRTSQPTTASPSAVLTSSAAGGRESIYWTGHYLELIFAYTYTRMGETVLAEDLAKTARSAMRVDDGTSKRRRGKPKPDVVHHWAQSAYGFRIEEAAAGKPTTGQLPPTLLDSVKEFSQEEAYCVDYLRGQSILLEPDEEIDAYRRVRRHDNDELSGELAALFDIAEGDRLAERLTELWAGVRKSNADERARVLKTALELGPRVGESFTLGLLAEVEPTLADDPPILAVIGLLERAVRAGSHFGQSEGVRRFVRQIEALFADFRSLDPGTRNGWEAFKAFERLLSHAVRGLRKLGLRDEINHLLERMNEAVLAEYAADTGDGLPDRPEGLQFLLSIVAGWFYFGQDDRCWPVLKKVRDRLGDGTDIGTSDRLRLRLCTGYIHAICQAPVDEAVDRLGDLFRPAEEGGLIRINRHHTTGTHYSIQQIQVAEAVAAALVNEDFTLDRRGRMWLDDDEYRLRRRIHRDVRVATEG